MGRIMIVDDERDVVTLVKFLLEREGHKVVEAYNGAEALRKLGVDPRDDAVVLPALLIIDVIMPVMDGYTVCAKLAENPRTKAIPIVVLTGKGENRDLPRPSPSIAAHLDKPFNPKDLRELVTGTLAQAH